VKLRGLLEWVGSRVGDGSVRRPFHRTGPATAPLVTETRLLADVQTLNQIQDGLEQLQERAENMEIADAAARRGYLTPFEDDRVRQGLLAYRNYRLALYDIILRLESYAGLTPPVLRLKAFLVAYVAALTLYAKSLRLNELAGRSELIRAKLNEAEPKFDLEAGFFDEVMSAFCSLRNYGLILRAQWFWSSRRREIRALTRREPEPWSGLERSAAHERRAVQAALNRVLRARMRVGWRTFWRTAWKPVGRFRHGLRSQMGTRFAGFWLDPQRHQPVDDALLSRIRSRLQPGDVLLTRSEGKLTATLLPGFWAHAAIYLGDPEGASRAQPPPASSGPVAEAGTVGRLSAEDRPTPCRADKEAEAAGRVIEAVSPCVRTVSLRTCLDADHVLVLRPRLEPAMVRDAVCEAMRHLGKAYDFEFDFSHSHRIVCTGLVYRSYHGRGDVEFRLVKRLGRFTLTGDDIAEQALARTAAGPPAFAPVALALRTRNGWRVAENPDRVRSWLGRIERGWRPIRS